MDIAPANFAAEQAVFRQNLAQGMIKQQANADKAMANVLEQAVKAAPSSGRGTLVDVTV